MSIANTTVYSADVLVEFNRQHMRKNPLFWVSFAMSLGYVLLVVLMNALWLLLFQEPYLDTFMIACMVILLLLVLFLVLYYTVFLKLAIKKNTLLDATVSYVFTPEGFEDHTVSKNMTQSSTVQYAMIHRVRETKNFFYLYIAPNMAHIVDKRGFTEGSVEDLRFLLIQQIDKGKRNF